MDDQYPSTSKDFQNCHSQEFNSNGQPKYTNVIFVSSTDSEGETKLFKMTQRKHKCTKQLKVDKVIKFLDYIIYISVI